MSGGSRDFNNMQTRALKFFSPARQDAEGNSRHSDRNAPSYATVKNCVSQFKSGDFSTCNAPRPGRPKTVATPEIIVQIHELILEDRRISAKSIAEQLSISRDRAGPIIHEDFDMRKRSGTRNAWKRIKNVNGASRT